MKFFLFKTAVVTSAVMLLTSCNNNNPNSTSVDGKDTTATTTAMDPKMADTSTMQSPKMNNGGMAGTTNEFVEKASAGGMTEVEASKLAATNGMNSSVKDFAAMMVMDHTKAGDELNSIAAAENISCPMTLPADNAMHVKELGEKKGADFDKAYVAMMVSDHAKTIEVFKAAASGNSNEKVKAFAAKTLPTIESHYAKIKDIQAKMK